MIPIRIMNEGGGAGSTMAEKLSQARRRGLHPETEPIGYMQPHVTVTFAMERGLYEWLAGQVGIGEHSFCVEDALNKAVAAMKGDQPLLGLTQNLAEARNTDLLSVLVGPRWNADGQEDSGDGGPNERAARRLLHASLFLAQVERYGMERAIDLFGVPPDDSVALAQEAVGDDRDLRAEITAAQESRAADAGHNARIDDPCDRDDIPF